MKLSMLSLSLLLSFNLMAHDEGHGPAIKDESLKGGAVTAIIAEKDVNKGRKAQMIYKGELVHESRGEDVKLYIYSQDMKPIDLSKFKKEVKGVQIETGKEKEFTLALDESGKFF